MTSETVDFPFESPCWTFRATTTLDTSGRPVWVVVAGDGSDRIRAEAPSRLDAWQVALAEARRLLAPEM